MITRQQIAKPPNFGLILRQSRRDSGIALVSVLWIVALLSIVALGVSALTRSESRMARNTLFVTQARYAAEGAVELAVSKLLSPAPDKWPADGSVQKIQIGDAVVKVAIFNESGRVDINMASAELLEALIRNTGLESEQRLSLVDAILDWRDPDTLRRLHGSEDDDYSAAGYSYGAKDGKFESVDELGLVMGMTPDLMQIVRPFLTVYSGQPGINPDAAPAELLRALAADDQTLAVQGDNAQRLSTQTTGREESTTVDRRFTSASAGPVYTIHVESQIDQSIVARLAVTVLLVGGAEHYKLLDWRHNAELFVGESDG